MGDFVIAGPRSLAFQNSKDMDTNGHEPSVLDDSMSQDKAKAQQQQDCLTCKTIGAMTFIGAGAYVLYEGQKQLEVERLKVILHKQGRWKYMARKSSVSMLGFSLAGLGLYRFLL